ncbi:MAG: FAD-binding oxidoreductase [Streptomyces sp.]|uniref:NAD(P)/FAD-dependent oxidoreductase n=1 Tax=Streptomyces sp. TaxID=1931 RepID=UPI0025E52019|nr:FAD-dependent oxidoreductase [Streptomyces sp.]MBW8794659.1 FAD-binding oxidoreductase [Streptomyces sp.]
MSSDAQGADVVVVGSGVVGLTVAWLLALRDAEVTVLDAAAPGAGASHAAQGELVPPSPELETCFRRSLALYARLAAQSGMRWDDEPVGTLLLTAPPEAVSPFSPDSPADPAGRAGHDSGAGPAARSVTGSEAVPRGELAALEPAVGPHVRAARLLAEGRRIEPAAVLDALVCAGRKAGVMSRSGLGPVSLQQSPGGRWAVVGAAGARFAARQVVVTAGLGSAALLAPHGIHIPLSGVRGRVLITEPVAPTLRRVLAEDSIGAPRSVALLAHQTPQGRLVLGGSWYPQDAAEPADLTERILTRARRLLPGIGEPRVVTERRGLRPTLPDRRPVVDRLAPGLFGCFGHGGEGYIAGPGTAELLAELVTDDREIAAGTEQAAGQLSARRWAATSAPMRRAAE